LNVQLLILMVLNVNDSHIAILRRRSCCWRWRWMLMIFC